MKEKSLEEEIKIKAQQSRKLARYMSSTQDLVEGQIEKAQKEGKFNSLPGAGQPLNLQENPFEPPELRMMFKILKDNDFAPYWIELGKEIDAALDKLWSDVDYFARYTSIFYREKRNAQAYKRYEKKRAHFYFESRIRLEEINKKILDYNLHCPTYQVGRANITVDDEMYRVISIIEKAMDEAGTNEK